MCAVLEIVRARWGAAAHLVFLVFCLVTNTLVSAMLILGGASVTNALTGVDLYAASFIIPVGVIFYTAAGGLKATFMASYIHTGILYIALCIFVFGIYVTDAAGLGSPGKVRRLNFCVLGAELESCVTNVHALPNKSVTCSL